MQSKSINDHELVKICLTELCVHTGFPSSGKLVQRDLAALCDIIESKTGVLISLSTIRRLLNGQFSRLPQAATLDAIAVTAGYQNWRNFISSKNHEAGKKSGHFQTQSKARYPGRHAGPGIIGHSRHHHAP